MKDVCVKLNNVRFSHNPAIPVSNPEEYRMWIKSNIKKDEYYILKNTDFVYFLNKEDLLAFTLKFGKVYEYKENYMMPKVEKMILQEIAIENKYKKEK